MKEKYVAFEAENHDFETFDTFEDAKKWLDDYGEGCDITEGAMTGDNFIAKITHRSKYIVTDEKKNYHQHTDECPEDCDGEEWPYDSDFDSVGNIIYEPVEGEKG
jgi:hypothetical protein